ncbi:MAG: DUF1492 domain-containing protein [Oscillospiraceae bacterium]|nr:DUF1492 domain-containing protein [Oscillospiraceae bacterium]
MNWKYESIEKLKGYEAHLASLTSIPEEISRLESAACSIRSATADGTAVSGGGNKREDMLLSNIVLREELERKLEQAKLWVSVVERSLGVLDDEERRVLDLMYIHRQPGSVERLCSELCCEKPTVYRRRDAALHKFTVALYGLEV